MSKRLTAEIQRDGDGFVSLCPELDIASQGDTIEEARDSLHEALELFFECASQAEIEQRMDFNDNSVNQRRPHQRE
jgi:predicted RNase H-like HicB family nuclease